MSEHESQAATTQKQASVKRKRRPKHEDPPAQEIDEQLGRGKKLTNERKDALVRAIKAGLRNGMRPSAVLQGCMTQFALGKNTVTNYLQIARSEMIESSGLWPEQIRDICEQELLEIIKSKAANNAGAKVRAIQIMIERFGINVTPQDTLDRKKIIEQEAMAKLDRMEIQELEEFAKNLRNGEKLTPEMLMLSPDELDKNRPRKKKKKPRYDTDH